MTEQEFEAFLADCSQELKEKQADAEARYGLAGMSRWSLDEQQHVLSFMNADGRAAVRFSVTPIGTYSVRQENWKWAWANPHLKAAFREKAEALKALQVVTDFDFFAEADAFVADEVMAWEMAAIAVQHLGAMACYRAPNQDTWLFLALDGPL